MANIIKIVPSSSLFEITGSEESDALTSRFELTGSALNINYSTPTASNSVEILKLKRKHPVGVEAPSNTSLEVGFYGKSKNTPNILYAKDIYTLKSTGSFGTDAVVTYKKSLTVAGSSVLVEKKTPGIHEEFILADNGLNSETFIRRSYIMVGSTVGATQNAFLTLKHTELQTPPNQTWIELNQNESAQITVQVIGRAGGTGARSRSFILNGYADTLNANGTIDGNFAIVNTVGQQNTAPPANWNVQLQFEDNYLGNASNYIRVQVFNNSNENETITWTAFVELIVNTSEATARYGGI